MAEELDSLIYPARLISEDGTSLRFGPWGDTPGVKCVMHDLAPVMWAMSLPGVWPQAITWARAGPWGSLHSRVLANNMKPYIVTRGQLSPTEDPLPGQKLDIAGCLIRLAAGPYFCLHY